MGRFGNHCDALAGEPVRSLRHDRPHLAGGHRRKRAQHVARALRWRPLRAPRRQDRRAAAIRGPSCIQTAADAGAPFPVRQGYQNEGAAREVQFCRGRIVWRRVRHRKGQGLLAVSGGLGSDACRLAQGRRTAIGCNRQPCPEPRSVCQADNRLVLARYKRRESDAELEIDARIGFQPCRPAFAGSGHWGGSTPVRECQDRRHGKSVRYRSLAGLPCNWQREGPRAASRRRAARARCPSLPDADATAQEMPWNAGRRSRPLQAPARGRQALPKGRHPQVPGPPPARQCPRRKRICRFLPRA